MQPNVQLLFVVDDHDDKRPRCAIGGRFACEPFQTASKDAIERGEAGANDVGFASVVGRAWGPPQPRPSATNGFRWDGAQSEVAHRSLRYSG